MAVSLHPRCSADTCIKCRRKFQPGDRVQVVHIVEKLGFNPSNVREAGAWLSPEFELQHAMCDNPTLDGTITVGSVA